MGNSYFFLHSANKCEVIEHVATQIKCFEILIMNIQKKKHLKPSQLWASASNPAIEI